MNEINNNPPKYLFFFFSKKFSIKNISNANNIKLINCALAVTKPLIAKVQINVPKAATVLLLLTKTFVLNTTKSKIIKNTIEEIYIPLIPIK